MQGGGPCCNSFLACSACFCRWDSLQLVDVYGEEVMSRPSVAKWCSDFKSSRVGTTDNERSGRPTTASTPENKARIEAAILGLSELEHDLRLSNGTIIRIIQEFGFRKVLRDGFREHFVKTTRRKEWLVLSHSSNNMPFMAMISLNALSLETRRGFTVTPQRQNVQEWSGNIPGPRDRKNSRWSNLLAK